MVFNQKNYEKLVKFSKQLLKIQKHETKIETKIFNQIILKKAKELGLNKKDLQNIPKQPRKISYKIYKSIMSNTNISDYDKNIWQRDLDGKVPRGCYSHQYIYTPPIGTEGYRRFKKLTDCGEHSVCVDNGIDKESLDILNKNKNINIAWACDGEHHASDPENIEIGQNIPLLYPCLVIIYKGKSRKKLNFVIKSILEIATIKDNDTGINIYENMIPKESKIFSIYGKERNNKIWWIKLANKLNNLL